MLIPIKKEPFFVLPRPWRHFSWEKGLVKIKQRRRTFFSRKFKKRRKRGVEKKSRAECQRPKMKTAGLKNLWWDVTECVRAQTTMNISAAPAKERQRHGWKDGTHHELYVFSTYLHLQKASKQELLRSTLDLYHEISFYFIANVKIRWYCHWLLQIVRIIAVILQHRGCDLSEVPLKSSKGTLVAGWTELHHVV